MPGRWFTVAEFHQLLDEAVAPSRPGARLSHRHGHGLRPGPKFTTFELVDCEDDGRRCKAVLSVGVFVPFAREIRKTLTAAGA